MKTKIIFLLILVSCFIFQLSFAQNYHVNVHDTDFTAIPGSGLDIKVDIEFDGSITRLGLIWGITRSEKN